MIIDEEDFDRSQDDPIKKGYALAKEWFALDEVQVIGQLPDGRYVVSETADADDVNPDVWPIPESGLIDHEALDDGEYDSTPLSTITDDLDFAVVDDRYQTLQDFLDVLKAAHTVD